MFYVEKNILINEIIFGIKTKHLSRTTPINEKDAIIIGKIDYSDPSLVISITGMK